MTSNLIDRPQSATLRLEGLPLLEEYETEGMGLTYHISAEHNAKGDGPGSDRATVQSSPDRNGAATVFALVPSFTNADGGPPPGGRALPRSEGYHRGCFICLDCPRVGRRLPYLTFPLPIHHREHRKKYPTHHTTYYCAWPCDGAYHSLSSIQGVDANSTYGGQRPGAGAPKGNLNALRTGTRAKDPEIRKLFKELSDDQKPLAARALRLRRPNNGS